MIQNRSCSCIALHHLCSNYGFWAEDNPTERAYKAASLVRYNISFNDLSSMKLRLSKSVECEAMTSAPQCKAGAASSRRPPPSNAMPEVKEEQQEPTRDKLLESLRKCDVRLASSTNDLRRTKAQVICTKDQDPGRRAAELQQGIESHFAIHDKLLGCLASAEDDFDVKEATDLQTDIFAHLEAAINARRRRKHWMESLKVYGVRRCRHEQSGALHDGRNTEGKTT